MDLKEAKVLITGGTQGIGKSTAQLLKNSGADVFVISRDNSKVASTSEEIGCRGCSGDVSDEKSVSHFFSQAIEEMGKVNVVINNAAYGYMSPLEDIELDKFENLLKTNLTGAMLVAREAARHFKNENYGNLINISSTAGLNGYPQGSPYVATKFALKGMTECWRKELRAHNVRTILINPSEVQTEFLSNAGRDKRPFNESKLVGEDIAQTIKAVLEMNDRALITESTVWATNPS